MTTLNRDTMIHRLEFIADPTLLNKISQEVAKVRAAIHHAYPTPDPADSLRFVIEELVEIRRWHWMKTKPYKRNNKHHDNIEREVAQCLWMAFTAVEGFSGELTLQKHLFLESMGTELDETIDLMITAASGLTITYDIMRKEEDWEDSEEWLTHVCGLISALVGIPIPNLNTAELVLAYNQEMFDKWNLPAKVEPAVSILPE